MRLNEEESDDNSGRKKSALKEKKKTLAAEPAPAYTFSSLRTDKKKRHWLSQKHCAETSPNVIKQHREYCIDDITYLCLVAASKNSFNRRKGVYKLFDFNTVTKNHYCISCRGCHDDAGAIKKLNVFVQVHLLKAPGIHHINTLVRVTGRLQVGCHRNMESAVSCALTW